MTGLISDRLICSGTAIAARTHNATFRARSHRQGNCRNFICGVYFQIVSLMGTCNKRITGRETESAILAEPSARFLHARYAAIEANAISATKIHEALSRTWS